MRDKELEMNFCMIEMLGPKFIWDIIVIVQLIFIQEKSDSEVILLCMGQEVLHSALHWQEM